MTCPLGCACGNPMPLSLPHTPIPRLVFVHGDLLPVVCGSVRSLCSLPEIQHQPKLHLGFLVCQEMLCLLLLSLLRVVGVKHVFGTVSSFSFSSKSPDVN